MTKEQDNFLIKHPNPSTKINFDSKEWGKDFIKNLKMFPVELQKSFLLIPKDVRKKLLETEMFKDNKSELRVMSAEEFEAHLRNDRQSLQIYYRDEITNMDDKEREIRIDWMIHDLLYRLGIKNESYLHDYMQHHSITDLLSLIWSQRGKPETEIKTPHDAEYNELQKQFQEIETRKSQLISEMKRLQSKKSLNRPNQQKLNTLNKELVDEYRLRMDFHDGKIYGLENSFTQGDKIAKELTKLRGFEAKFKSLVYFIEYIDGMSFLILVSEKLDYFAPNLKKRFPESAQDLERQLAEWGALHSSDSPLLTQTEQKTTEKKLSKHDKHIKHFWRLFNSSIDLMKNKESHAQDSLESTLAEFSVLLKMLSK